MIYFDHAATGFPKSEGVLRAIMKAHRTFGNPGRSGHLPARMAEEMLFECRTRLAELFGSTPENVVLTSGATVALNLAIKGLYTPGGEVVTSDLEHNAVMRPLQALRLAQQITLKQFHVDLTSDDKTVEHFALCAGKHAGMAVITHASNVCGRLLPIERMRESVAREDFVIVADCSQTAGHIPIDIRKLGADVICIPGHKGLYGPMGTGALICNPDREIHFRTLIEGGSGVQSLSSGMPDFLPERLEPGTPNVCGIAGLCAAAEEFRYPREEGRLCELLAEGLKSRRGVRIHGREDGGAYLPVVLFNLEGTDCETVADALSAKGFAVRAGLHCAPAAHRSLGTLETGGVRVSIGRGNTEEDVRRFLAALEQKNTP